MTFILRKLPFAETGSTASVGGEQVVARAYQIVAWANLGVQDTLEQDAPRFPVIVDTGNNHNFAIQEDHLRRWAGLSLEGITAVRHVHVGTHRVPVVRAEVWLHPNKPGQRDAFARKAPVRSAFEEGIIVYPSGTPTVARLPILGLRALAQSGLYLAVDGHKRQVHLRTT